jgi:hypothetical protein
VEQRANIGEIEMRLRGGGFSQRPQYRRRKLVGAQAAGNAKQAEGN